PAVAAVVVRGARDGARAHAPTGAVAALGRAAGDVAQRAHGGLAHPDAGAAGGGGRRLSLRLHRLSSPRPGAPVAHAAAARPVGRLDAGRARPFLEPRAAGAAPGSLRLRG